MNLVVALQPVAPRIGPDPFTDHFTNHDATKVGVSARHIRHNRCVSNDKLINTMAATVLVHHAKRVSVRAHF